MTNEIEVSLTRPTLNLRLTCVLPFLHSNLLRVNIKISHPPSPYVGYCAVLLLLVFCFYFSGSMKGGQPAKPSITLARQPIVLQIPVIVFLMHLCAFYSIPWFFPEAQVFSPGIGSLGVYHMITTEGVVGYFVTPFFTT